MRYTGQRKYPWLIIILGLIFFWKILLNPGKMIYWSFSDITLYHSPLKFIIHRAFNAQGAVPLWNPYIFGGTPLVANPQAGLFYPLNMLLHALSALLAGPAIRLSCGAAHNIWRAGHVPSHEKYRA